MNATIRFLTGGGRLQEADELDPKPMPPVGDAPELPDDAGTLPPENGGPAEPEPGAAEDEYSGEAVITDLLSAWRSGSRAGVAQRLMYTPISYVTFVKLIQRLDPADSVELGQHLDDLADSISSPSDTDTILPKFGQKPEAEIPGKEKPKDFGDELGDSVNAMTEPGAEEEEPQQ